MIDAGGLAGLTAVYLKLLEELLLQQLQLEPECPLVDVASCCSGCCSRLFLQSSLVHLLSMSPHRRRHLIPLYQTRKRQNSDDVCAAVDADADADAVKKEMKAEEC